MFQIIANIFSPKKNPSTNTLPPPFPPNPVSSRKKKMRYDTILKKWRRRAKWQYLDGGFVRSCAKAANTPKKRRHHFFRMPSSVFFLFRRGFVTVCPWALLVMH
jgi:hypothetical protein